MLGGTPPVYRTHKPVRPPPSHVLAEISPAHVRAQQFQVHGNRVDQTGKFSSGMPSRGPGESGSLLRPLDHSLCRARAGPLRSTDWHDTQADAAFVKGSTQAYGSSLVASGQVRRPAQQEMGPSVGAQSSRRLTQLQGASLQGLTGFPLHSKHSIIRPPAAASLKEPLMGLRWFHRQSDQVTRSVRHHSDFLNPQTLEARFRSPALRLSSCRTRGVASMAGVNGSSCSCIESVVPPVQSLSMLKVSFQTLDLASLESTSDLNWTTTTKREGVGSFLPLLPSPLEACRTLAAPWVETLVSRDSEQWFQAPAE